MTGALETLKDEEEEEEERFEIYFQSGILLGVTRDFLQIMRRSFHKPVSRVI